MAAMHPTLRRCQITANRRVEDRAVAVTGLYDLLDAMKLARHPMEPEVLRLANLVADLSGPERPRWLDDIAYTDDALEEAVQDAIDPEAERGEIVVTHYAVTWCEREDADPRRPMRRAEWCDVLGVEVQGTTGTRFISRADLVAMGVDCAGADDWLADKSSAAMERAAFARAGMGGEAA